MLLRVVKNDCSNHLAIIHEMMNVQDPDGMDGDIDKYPARRSALMDQSITEPFGG